jgi:DNA polymerase-3 subunit gamma/tau
MAYEVFARKYRPKVFDDLVGQEAIAQTLRHAVASGRTASVYLFAGSHGVGKTSVARILAKALNCPNVKDGAPCGTCEVCESIARGDCLDVVEIDAASNSKVDDVRLLRDSVSYKPASCRFKVYILDEVHRLSTNAFDALLKTFEESPATVRFVLATTELHKVPTTILSRAQVFRFQRAGLTDIVRSLRRICTAENLSAEDEALRAIARRARGSMRDSQKLLDQVVALAAGNSALIKAADVAFLLGDATQDVVARCLRAIASGDPGVLLAEVDQHVRAGGRPDALVVDMTEALRGALYLKTAGPSSPLLDDVALSKEDLEPAASALSEEGVLYALQLLQEAQIKMRDVRDPRLVLELVLVRLARARELLPLGEVLARLERLERALGQAPGGGGGPGVKPVAAAPPPRAASPGATPVAAPASPPAVEKPRAAPLKPSSESDPGPRSYSYPAEFTRKPVSAPQAVASPAGAVAAATISAVALADAPVVAAAPVLTAESIAARWDQVREAARKSSVQLGKALERSRPRAFQGRRLTIEVRVPDFLFGQLESAALKEPLTKLLREQLACAELELGFERGRDVPGEGGPAAVRSVYDEPIVKHAQRLFGALPVGGGW